MYMTWARVKRVAAVIDAKPLGLKALWFVALHIPLALAMHFVSFVTAVHAFGTVFIGIGIAWGTNRRLDRVAYICAYITGAEVLWRMNNDHLFWELGKFSLVAICASATFRTNTRALVWGSLAFALLLPSTYLTLKYYDLSEARNQLSFNMSGPLALCMCSAFFSQVTLSREQFKRLCLAAVAPAVGIAAKTLYGIVTNPDIVFSHQSNFALSGGFGPNQVSAALGLGALMALMFLFEEDSRWFLRAGIFAVVLWLAMQSALTFSRGGLAAALGAAIVAMCVRVSDPRALVKPVLMGLVVLALGYTVLWPRLDAFTGGNITQRFADTDTSLRADLGEADMQLWRENPMLGVGPGRSKLGHLDDIISHTEFTRLLAEHGVFGLFAMLLLVFFGARNAWNAASGRERGYAAAFPTWALLFMSNSAMRLCAPSFMFGFAFCRLKPATKPVQTAARPVRRQHSQWNLMSSPRKARAS